MHEQTFPTEVALGISERARRRGLIALLIDVFCMYTGFFMVVPLISVHYVDGLGWAAASIGLALGARQFTQQGLTVASGMLADRVGAKLLICLGLTIRIAGFVLLARATTLPLLFAACILAAVGGALFESPRAAAIAALTHPDERQRFYSLSGAIAGIGMAVGPLLGSVLLRVDFSLAALVGAACFTVNLIQTLLLLPSVRVSARHDRLTHGLRLVAQDRSFIAFVALLMGYWFVWVQINISLPLMAEKLTNTTTSVGIIYAVNAAMVVTLQYPLVRVFGRRFDQLTLLTIGMVVMSIGIGSVAFAHGLAGLIVSVIVFSLGGLIVQPTQQTITASLARPTALGSYFGVSSLALAIGGGLGNYCGGLLYSLGQQQGISTLPWMSFASVGFVASAGLAYLAQRHRGRHIEVVLSRIFHALKLR